MRTRLSELGRQCRRHAPFVAVVVVGLLATDTDRSALPMPAAAPTSAAALVVPWRAPTTPPIASPVPHAPMLVVRVSDEAAPRADVEVVLSNGNSATRQTVRTDREGIARFADVAPGPYEVWAAHEHRASSLARVDVTGNAEVALALGPASIVRGELTTAEGAVAAAGTVELVPLDGDHAVRIATIDATGHFVVPGVPMGRWRIATQVPTHAQVEDAIIVAGDADVTTAVRVVPTGTVAGRVVDDTGAPVANAMLILRDAAATPLSIRRAPFELIATPTRWVHPLAASRHLPHLTSARFGAARVGSRPSECGRGHCGVDLGHERGDIVHAIADGVVVALFPENRTEAGRVVAIHHGGGLRSMYMHLDELRPGLEVGHAIRAGDAIGTLGSTGIVRSAPHLHFAITQERAGRTWYVDPEPVLRHAVVLAAPRTFDVFEPSGAAPVLEAAAIPARFTTDASGAFRIDGVAPGSYVAVAFAEQLAPGTSALVEVRSNELAPDVAITLSAGAIVHGRVIGAGGAVANAQVIASAGTGASTAKIASTTTDKYGEYTLRALSGKVTLSINAHGFTDGERTITVAENPTQRTRHRQDFTLAVENAQLRGQLFAPDGGAAAGVYIRITDGISRRTTVSDAQGRFDLSPVAAGHYVLELSSRDYPTKRVTLDAGRWIDIRLDRGGAITATVRAGGDPLANVRVTARGPAGQMLERATDARGALDLRALPSGTWTLSARAPGFSSATQTVTVRAGEAPAHATLELTRAATLIGVVRDRFGQRVAGATLRFGSTTTISAGDGSFRIDDAPSGSGVLEADFDGLHGALQLQLAPGDERLSLTVELR